MSILILSLKGIVFALLISCSIKGIVLETSVVINFVWMIVSIRRLGSVIDKISIVKWSIWEDECSLSLSFAMQKLTNK